MSEDRWPRSNLDPPDLDGDLEVKKDGVVGDDEATHRAQQTSDQV